MKNSLDNFTQAFWNFGSALRHADAWVSSQRMDGIYNIPFTGVCSENSILRLFWSFFFLKNLSHKVYITSVQIWGKSSHPTLQKFYSCIELLLSMEVFLFPWVHLRNHPLMHSELDCLLSCSQPALPVAIHMDTQLEKKHQENIYSFNVLKQN